MFRNFEEKAAERKEAGSNSFMIKDQITHSKTSLGDRRYEGSEKIKTVEIMFTGQNFQRLNHKDTKSRSCAEVRLQVGNLSSPL